MSHIDVAIAIVTYRSAELAIGCLRSIEAERSSSSLLIRVIVVDNASKDAPLIAEAIKSNNWLSWVTLVEAPRNGGFAYGNNVAFEHAFDRGRPDYLYMLNPDTLVRNGAIDALVRFLEAHPGVGIAGSSLEEIDGTDWQFAFRFPSILGELERGLQLRAATRLFRRWVVTMKMGTAPQLVDWLPGASMMVRREVLEAIGGLDESYFLYFEETDFCFRAKKAGFSTSYVPESRIMHVRGQSTKVMERNTAPRRLPAYWFESRRRYFVSSYGMPYAIAADVVALLANGLGSLKRIIQGQGDSGVPYFLTDLANHSVLWSRNRELATIKRVSNICTPQASGHSS
jgi:N-acetylglucosaminyl-diphospho-decaprenol L-rhamnosyltransferase